MTHPTSPSPASPCQSRRGRWAALWAVLLVLAGMWGGAFGSGQAAWAQPPGLADALAGEDETEPVRVSFVASVAAARPGDQFAVAVVFDHAPGWHVHTNEPKVPASWQPFNAIATTVVIEGAGATAGQPQWPQSKTITADLAGTGTPEPYAVFGGKAVVFVPITLGSDVPTGQPVTLRAKLRYQACNDRTCQLPQNTTLELTLPVLAPGEPSPGVPNAELFAGFDASAFAAGAQASTRFRENVFGWEISFDAGGAGGLAVLLLLAMLGGFVLNLTPCVLPVIPIKIMGLAASAGGSRTRTLLLGVMMTLGVVGFWLAIAGLMVGVSGFTAINQLFQQPLFTLGVGAFIAIMAVGMMGLFTLNLPGVVYLLDPKKESVLGSILFGVMTAVLSTPCTAPFMAGAVAWSTKQPAFVTFLTFGAIGLGMALPYLALAAFPGLVAKVPKTGPASELVKQVMGVLMLAVAAFFVGTGLDPLLREPIDPPMRGYWFVVAAFVALAMGWMLYRMTKIKVRPGALVVGGLVGLMLTAGASAWALKQNDKGPIRWVGYTPERFAEARQSGKVIVVDFTAEWCLNCKVLESTVLFRPEVAEQLNAEGVIAFKVDLTGDNQPGQAKLRELGWAGIPLLAVYGPGLPEDRPIRYDSYTPTMVLDALSQARGAGSAAR